MCLGMCVELTWLQFLAWALWNLRNRNNTGMTCAQSVNNSPAMQETASKAGVPGMIPGLRRFPGEGNGNPPQYSCLENPMDGRAWQATCHGVAKSQTRLSDFTFLLLWLSCWYAKKLKSTHLCCDPSQSVSFQRTEFSRMLKLSFMHCKQQNFFFN